MRCTVFGNACCACPLADVLYFFDGVVWPAVYFCLHPREEISNCEVPVDQFCSPFGGDDDGGWDRQSDIIDSWKEDVLCFRVRICAFDVGNVTVFSPREF